MAKRWKILCLLLTLVMVLGAVAACKQVEEPDPTPPVDNTTPQAPVDTIDLSEYTIVRPASKGNKKLSTLFVSSVTSFRTAVNTLTGSDVGIEDDEAEAANSDRKEILIGATNRPESETAMAELPGEHNFYIRKIGNKLTIVGHTEELVSKGLTYLLENYVSKSTGNGKFDIDVDFKYTQAYKYHEIVTDNMPQYELIYSMTANNSVKNSTETVWKQINRLTTQDAVIDFDHIHPLYGVEYLLSRTAIVVGPTNFPRTQELKATTEYFSWVIETEQDQIYLFGSDNASIEAVCAQMTMLIDAGKIVTIEEDDNGKTIKYTTVRITKDEPIVGVGNDWSGRIPQFNGGVLDSVEEFHEDYYRLYYTGTTRSAYDLYQAKVLSSGYTLYDSNELEGNVYNTYKSDSMMLHTYYLAAQNTVSIAITDLENFTDYPTAPVSDTAVTDPSMGVAMMDYTKVTKTDGVGFVYTMADGSYVIIDGGHGRTWGSKEVQVPVLDEEGNPVLDEDGKEMTTTQKEYYLTYEGVSEKLYQYLKENNSRPDEKILIRAWILTNAKSDHYGAFVDFAADYGKEVTLEYFVAQFDYDKQIKADSTGVATGNGEDIEKIKNAVISFGKVKKIVPLVGQKMYFGTLEVNYLYTAEVYCHADPENVGDHSLVIKAYFEDYSFLFTSDIGLDTLKILTNNYTAETLKSDFVQAPNHGNTGTRKFWSAALPTYLFINTTTAKADVSVMNSIAAIDYMMMLVDENNEQFVKAYFDGQGKFGYEAATFPFDFIAKGENDYTDGNYEDEKDTVGWGDLSQGETVAPSEDHRPGDYENDKDSTTWEDMIAPTTA